MSKGTMMNLSRPAPGAQNTVTLVTGIRFAKLISRKFCRHFHPRLGCAPLQRLIWAAHVSSGYEPRPKPVPVLNVIPTNR